MDVLSYRNALVVHSADDSAYTFVLYSINQDVWYISMDSHAGLQGIISLTNGKRILEHLRSYLSLYRLDLLGYDHTNTTTTLKSPIASTNRTKDMSD